MKGKFEKIHNVITTVITCCIVIFIILIFGLKLFGFNTFVVRSGSMEPKYHVGSLVYTKPVDATKLTQGDVITFRQNNVNCTHRIVEVVNEQNQLSFITKGDSNKDVDANLVQSKEIVGKVLFSIPYLGFLVTYMQQPPGIYIVISILVVCILFTIVPEFVCLRRKKK